MIDRSVCVIAVAFTALFAAHGGAFGQVSSTVATKADVDAAWSKGDYAKALELLEQKPVAQRSVNRKLAIATAAFNAGAMAKAVTQVDELQITPGLTAEQKAQLARLTRAIEKESRRPVSVKVGEASFELSESAGTTKDMMKAATLKALEKCYAKVDSMPCERLTFGLAVD